MRAAARRLALAACLASTACRAPIDAARTWLEVPVRPARDAYSDDARQARHSLARVLDAIPDGAVRAVCTAHARCAALTPAVRRAIVGV